jgi:hypothetical protein
MLGVNPRTMLSVARRTLAPDADLRQSGPDGQDNGRPLR